MQLNFRVCLDLRRNNSVYNSSQPEVRVIELHGLQASVSFLQSVVMVITVSEAPADWRDDLSARAPRAARRRPSGRPRRSPDRRAAGA